MDRMNDRGMVTIDLMVAIVLLLAAVLMAIQIIPTMSHEDRDWRNKQYMATTRATDNLVQDTGDFGWEGNWRYSVTKIGLVYFDNNKTAMMKVLNSSKINALMGNGSLDINTSKRWWEFPNSSISETERDNAARSLGLEGYYFYLQLHPVGLEDFNSTPLINKLTDRSKVSINDYTVTVVDRYVYIKNESDSCEYICDNNNKTVHYRMNLWVW
jgi:hypothetical protein